MSFQIQSGTVDNFTAAGDDWYSVTFDTPFAEDATVVIQAQIQTYAGPDYPGLRLKKVSNTGFEVCMKEMYQSGATSSVAGDLGTVKGDGSHPNAETLGWIAVSQ
jgi:hypothetical protein